MTTLVENRVEAGSDFPSVPDELGQFSLLDCQDRIEKEKKNIDSATRSKDRHQYQKQLNYLNQKLVEMETMFSEFQNARSKGRYDWSDEQNAAINQLAEQLRLDQPYPLNQRTPRQLNESRIKYIEDSIKSWRDGMSDPSTAVPNFEWQIAKIIREKSARQEAVQRIKGESQDAR